MSFAGVKQVELKKLQIECQDMSILEAFLEFSEQQDTHGTKIEHFFAVVLQKQVN